MKITEITTKAEELLAIQEIWKAAHHMKGPSFKDVITLFDAHATTSKLISESISSDDFRVLKMMSQYGSEPKIGNKYIPIQFTFVNGQIIYPNENTSLKFLKLESKTINSYIMTDSQGNKFSYPDNIYGKIAYIDTIFLDGRESYEKLNTYSIMKFDKRMPELDASITEDNPKYFGATQKVKINKKGIQIPLNKKGFGA